MKNLIISGLLLAGISLPSFAQKDSTITVNVPADSITFAIVGDFGENSKEEGAVADMIKAWPIDFIITMGDNNYFLGARKSLKKNIGKYYGDYIYNPDAPVMLRCDGKAARDKTNRFFPAPGNHDHYSRHMKPYYEYFTLPGDESNYTFTWGPVQFFSMNSGSDGRVDCCDSPESKWLKQGLATSTAPFKFIYFHHPPYSPGDHGSATHLQWPYAQWGASAVLAGHEHFYARIQDMTTPELLYLISGNGGNTKLYNCNANPLDSTRFKVKCDGKNFGAVKVKVNKDVAVFEYYITSDPSHPTDTYILHRH